MENFISPEVFVESFKEAFGKHTELPLVFGYGRMPVADTPKIGGCLFKTLDEARKGVPVSFSADNTGCGGGKFYIGFSDMPEHIPEFVSLQEKYKKTPDMVLSFIKDLDRQPAPKPYLNFIRADLAKTFNDMEGLLFYATPDVLSGLTTWAFFDNNDAETVSTPFGSGCNVMIQMAVRENRMNGQRTFLGLFDPSVRPHVGANELGFVIPRSRFLTMQHTMKECCLYNTHAWQKVKERLLDGFN